MATVLAGLIERSCPGGRTVSIDGLRVDGSGPERKSAEAGTATVVLATLGVTDRDGDLILPGALANREAVVSRFEHSVVRRGDEPVGRASLEEKEGRLLAHIRYDDPAACRAVLDAKPDWSLGYVVLKSRDPTSAERAQGTRRVIERWEIREVSPVGKGAGVATGTLACACKSACGCSDAAPSLPNVADVVATLDRARLLVAVGEHRDRDLWAVIDEPRRALAQKALRFAASRLRVPLTLKWRHLDGAGGHFRPDEPGVVNLDPDLPLAEIPAVVFHEAQHAKDAALALTPYEESAEVVAARLLEAWRRDAEA